MPFAATFTRESTSEPGVTFTVKRMGFARRTDLDFLTLKWRQRLRELESDQPQASDEEKEIGGHYLIAVRKYAALVERLKTGDAGEADITHASEDVTKLKEELEASIPRAVKKTRTVLNEEYQGVTARIQAAWISEGLESIKGVSTKGGEFDGMSAAQLLEYGPQDLALEIYGALISDGRLDGAAQNSLKSPMPSGEAEDGLKTNTTAPSVEVPQVAGTRTETVSAIS